MGWLAVCSCHAHVHKRLTRALMSCRRPSAAQARRPCSSRAIASRCWTRARGQLLIKNLRNEVTKKCAPPCPATDAVFYAGTGMLLCRSEDKARCTFLSKPCQEATNLCCM